MACYIHQMFPNGTWNDVRQRLNRYINLWVVTQLMDPWK